MEMMENVTKNAHLLHMAQIAALHVNVPKKDQILAILKQVYVNVNLDITRSYVTKSVL